MIEALERELATKVSKEYILTREQMLAILTFMKEQQKLIGEKK